jgi:hypothetical protein
MLRRIAQCIIIGIALIAFSVAINIDTRGKANVNNNKQNLVNPTVIENLLGESFHALTNGDYNTAKSKLTQLLLLDPKHIDANQLMGKIAL